MKLQVIGLSVIVLSLLVTSAGSVSDQQQSDSPKTAPQEDASLEFLEKLAENGRRLADQAMGRVLELLNDSNKQKLKHITKDLWEKVTNALREVLEE